MSVELENLIASRFIARTDVKAQQFDAGGYTPVRTRPVPPAQVGENIPWQRQDITNHLAGVQTFGHYLVNTDDTCKLFAFDIDIDQSGMLPEAYDIEAGGWHTFGDVTDLRNAWLDRAHFARTYMKMQFNLVAQQFAKTVKEMLNLDVACAYSGAKGVHVYGFLPKQLTADQARQGGLLVLEQLQWEPSSGQNFFKSTDDDPTSGFPNLTVELFPKQDSLAGKDLGNLMRLPLGINRKNADPTFFFGFNGPLNTLTPVDSVQALTPGNDPWA